MNKKQRTNKKGFTLVELAIVMAVIAILLGVAVPSFSGLFEKANLNADKQLVDSMNLILEANENKNGKPTNVKTVMNILKNGGINSDWTCSAKNVEMYWCAKDDINRMVLIDKNDDPEGELIYPEEYANILWTNRTKESMRAYDQDNKDAAEVVFKMDGMACINFSDMKWVKLTGTLEHIVSDALFNAPVQETDTLYTVNYPKFESGDTTPRAYAKATSYRFGGTDTENRPQLIYISIEQSADFHAVTNADDAKALAEAQRGAAWILYCALHQIELGTLSDNTAIVIQGGITLDATGIEWNPIGKEKSFKGYLGTVIEYIDGNPTTTPAQIINVTLSSATNAEELLGTSSNGYKYAFAGFIGNMTSGTIENLTFKNFTISEPGNDDDVQHSMKGAKNNRNCVGLVGRVGGNVTFKNVTVSASTFTGASVVGGLVGFFGNYDGSPLSNATLTIDSCSVSSNLASVDYLSSDDCGSVGGFVGLMDGCAGTAEVKIQNSSFSGKTSSFRRTAGAVGYLASGKLVFAYSNDFENAKMDIKHAATYEAALAVTSNKDYVKFDEAYDADNEKQLTRLPQTTDSTPKDAYDAVVEINGSTVKSYKLDTAGTNEYEGSTASFKSDISGKVAFVYYQQSGSDTVEHGWVYGNSIPVNSLGRYYVPVGNQENTWKIVDADDEKAVTFKILWHQGTDNTPSYWEFTDDGKTYRHGFYPDSSYPEGNDYHGGDGLISLWEYTYTDNTTGSSRLVTLRYAGGDSWKYAKGYSETYTTLTEITK